MIYFLQVLALVVLLSLSGNTAFCSGFPVKIEVTEPSQIQRTNEYMSVGVPFSRDENLYSTSQLALYKKGVRVEAQFSVTGRWDGSPGDASKKIKWILVDFKVDSLAAGETINYELKNDGKDSAISGIEISETADQMVVNTGNAQFYLNKTSFDFLHRVVMDGRDLISPDGANGSTIVDLSNGLPSVKGGKSDLANRGTYTSRSSQILEFRVEPVESGKLHSIVTVRGISSTATGGKHIEWLYRMHFYKNSSAVKVSYSISERYLKSNLDRYDLDYVGIQAKLAPTGPITVTVGGEINSNSTFTAMLGPDNGLSLRQSGVVEQSLTAYNPGTLKDLFFTISGAVSGTGNRARGWINVSDGNVGLFSAVRNFWKMYPKELNVDGTGNLSIALWPTADVDMTFYGGAQRTHDLLYKFYTGTKTASEMEASNTQFQTPLFGFISPDYISSTNALGAFSSFRSSRFAPTFRPVIESLNTSVEKLGDWIASSREFDTNEPGKHSYGFWATGDNHRGDTFWAANDYDLVRAYVYAALTRETPASRYKWLQITSDTASHVYDVQLQHNYIHNRNDIGSDLKPVVRNGNTREKKYVGRSAYNPCDVFHDMGSNSRVNVNIEHQAGAQGLSYYYFITGDVMAKEAALSQRYYMRTFREFWNAGESNARSYGQFIQIWLGIYSLSGDPNDLDDLNYWLNYANRMQDSVTTYDPGGEIWNGSQNTTVSFMNSLMFLALADLYDTYPDRSTDLKKRMLKACRFTQDQTKHLWDDANQWFWRDPATTTDPGFYFSASPGFAFCSRYAATDSERKRYADIVFRAYTKGVVNTPISKEKDAASLLRGLFTGLHYLQRPRPPE